MKNKTPQKHREVHHKINEEVKIKSAANIEETRL